MAAALGCYSDAPTAARPSAAAEPVSQGVTDAPTQPRTEANQASTTAQTADNATRAQSDEDRGAAAANAQIPSIQSAAALSSQKLSPQQHFQAGQEKEKAGNSSE